MIDDKYRKAKDHNKIEADSFCNAQGSSKIGVWKNILKYNPVHGFRDSLRPRDGKHVHGYIDGGL